MALEDDLSDILKKARHGQSLSVDEVAGRCGVEPGRLRELERGAAASKDEVAGIAGALGLRPEPLVHIALNRWMPAPTPASVTEVHTIDGDIGGYAVKGYVLFEPQSREAALIDTGYNAPAVLRVLAEHDLRLTAVCLTHGHTDHAGQLEVILSRWPVPVYLGSEDRELAPWLPEPRLLTEPKDGARIPVGRLAVECMTTPGHTPGGICYRVRSAGRDLCFVGDTLFAGSIGRANPFSLYRAHLKSVRERVLTLPPAAVLFPGHGPNTTVAEELAHNPFAAEG